MLVLSRKVGERLIFDGVPGCPPIVVCVTRVSGNRITLGIEADDSIRVIRGELAGLPPKKAAEPTAADAPAATVAEGGKA